MGGEVVEIPIQKRGEKSIHKKRRRPIWKKTCTDKTCVPCNTPRCRVCFGCKYKKGCWLRKYQERKDSELKNLTPVKCQSCLQTFANSRTLYNHMKLNRCQKRDGYYVHRCNTCRLDCATVPEWRQHKANTGHQQCSFKCAKCEC